MLNEIIKTGVNLELSGLQNINNWDIIQFKEDIKKKRGEKIIYINGIHMIKKAVITGEFEFSKRGELKQGHYGHLHVPVENTQIFDKNSNKWEENFDKFIYTNHNLFKTNYEHFRLENGKDFIWGTGHEKNIYNIFIPNITKIYLGNKIVNKVLEKNLKPFD